MSRTKDQQALIARLDKDLETALHREATLSQQYTEILADLLLLEPHLKHYRFTDEQTRESGAYPGYLGAQGWDAPRIHRAANHLRGEQALESVGYTNAQHEADWSNVTFVDFRAPDPEGAA